MCMTYWSMQNGLSLWFCQSKNRFSLWITKWCLFLMAYICILYSSSSTVAPWVMSWTFLRHLESISKCCLTFNHLTIVCCNNYCTCWWSNIWIHSLIPLQICEATSMLMLNAIIVLPILVNCCRSALRIYFHSLNFPVRILFWHHICCHTARSTTKI